MYSRLFIYIFALILFYSDWKEKNCTEGDGVIIAADMELIAHSIMGWRENVVHLNNWILICNLSEIIPAARGQYLRCCCRFCFSWWCGFYLLFDLILLVFG